MSTSAGSTVKGLTHQLICGMLCKPERTKTVSTTGQQSDEDVRHGDPVGEVHPERRQRTTAVCCFAVGPPVIGNTVAHRWLCKVLI